MSTKFCAVDLSAFLWPHKEQSQITFLRSALITKACPSKGRQGFRFIVQEYSPGTELRKENSLPLKGCRRIPGGAEKYFCFFLEMQFLNGYKWYVVDVEILRFS
jgi:hypothetical protein